MQRAAASTAAKEAHASASEDNPPTPKRPRLSTEPDSPATPRTSDLEAISAALAAEEEKRREAIARQAAEAGETQWVLDIPSVTSQTPPRPPVVAADSLDADDEVNVGGRRPYGNFKRKGGEVSLSFFCTGWRKLISTTLRTNGTRKKLLMTTRERS